jgi:hypothetical protein
MNGSNDFFTLKTLATFGGLTFAVTVITNTFRSLSKREPKFVAFLISLVLCAVIAWTTFKHPLDYLIAMLNGCLVYCTSMGLNSQVSISTATPSKEPTRGEEKGKALKHVNHFFRPW